MEKANTECGHEAGQNYTNNQGEDVCLYCIRKEYVNQKKRPFAIGFGLAYLCCAVALPASFVVWLWVGYGAAWRLFVSALIMLWSFVGIFAIIVQALEKKADQKYPE